VERFEYIDTWVKKSFAYYDQLVSSSYIAFSDFALWNAWHRIWMLGGLYGVSALFEVLSEFESTGNPACFKRSERYPYRGVQALDLNEYAQLLLSAAKEVKAVGDKTRPVPEAVSNIYEFLRDSGLCPDPWNLTSSEKRCPGTFTLLPMLRLVAWGRYRSPEVIRRHYFLNGRARGLAKDVGKNVLNEFRRVSGVSGGILRDALFSWNRDWTGNDTAAVSDPLPQNDRSRVGGNNVSHNSSSGFPEKATE
jgi:FADH2 O2-dependent halogenase